jgi:hypothetical protein
MRDVLASVAERAVAGRRASAEPARAMSTADQAKALAELSAEIDALGGRKRR